MTPTELITLALVIGFGGSYAFLGLFAPRWLLGNKARS